MMERSHSCAEPFLEMLIDLRVKHDFPPGIAAMATADRAGLLAAAKKEFDVDAVDPRRTQTCEKVLASTPPDRLDGMVSELQSCLAQADCAGYVSCLQPIQDKRIAEGKAKMPKADPAMVASCNKVMTKAHACVEPFTEMLVDVRAELDLPKGIADAVKKDRAGVLAKAKEEAARDLGEGNRALLCQAAAFQTSPEVMKSAEACVSKPDCPGFVACMKPVQKKQLESAIEAAAAAQ